MSRSQCRFLGCHSGTRPLHASRARPGSQSRPMAVRITASTSGTCWKANEQHQPCPWSSREMARTWYASLHDSRWVTLSDCITCFEKHGHRWISRTEHSTRWARPCWEHSTSSFPRLEHQTERSQPVSDLLPNFEGTRVPYAAAMMEFSYVTNTLTFTENKVNASTGTRTIGE